MTELASVSNNWIVWLSTCQDNARNAFSYMLRRRPCRWHPFGERLVAWWLQCWQNDRLARWVGWLAGLASWQGWRGWQLASLLAALAGWQGWLLAET